MKKILIATTALVATAGVSSAEIALTGNAEMGIYDQGIVNRGVEFFTDVEVTFTMTGETDNGLSFGAVVDLDEGGAGGPSDDGGSYVFIKGGFGNITMGDTDGAMDWALTEAGNVGNPGSIADNETSHAGYLGSYADGANDGQILRYDNTFGAFGVAVSIDDDDGQAGSSVGYALGLKYTLDLSGTAVNLGFGYQKADVTNAAYTYNNFGGGIVPTTLDVTVIGISADAAFANGLSVGIQYAQHDFDNRATGANVVSIDHVGVGVGYTTGALSLHANYGEYKVDNTNFVSKGLGLAAAYDLGGGAQVQAGYGKNAVTGGGSANDNTTMSLGLRMDF